MKNFIIRTITGLLFACVLVVCIVYSPFTLLSLFSVVAALTIYEFAGIVNNRAGANVNALISAVAGFYLVCAVGGLTLGYTSVKELAPYLLTMIYLLVSELYRKNDDPLKNWAYAFASQIYIAFPFALLILTGVTYDAYLDRLQYEWIIPMSIFIFLWMSDSGAYLCGSLLSRYLPWKLFPRVSPAKSWIGSIGGCLLCIAAAIAIKHLFPQTMELWQWIVMSIVVCVSGTYGDLIESLFKRQMGIKDSGRILPGHGGFLDRFDSALLAIPSVVIYLYCIDVL